MRDVRIAVLKYGVGNTYSILSGLKRAGARPEIVLNVRDARRLDAVVLPGVGSYPAAMKRIGKDSDLLTEMVDKGKPVLGICLGMQLLFESSEEGGLTRGLSILRGRIVRIPARKLPHIGWSRVVRKNTASTLLNGVPDGAYFYFVHSYGLLDDLDVVKATTTYDELKLAAVVEYHPVYGTQFHPERSGFYGEVVLRNFVKIVRELG